MIKRPVKKKGRSLRGGMEAPLALQTLKIY